MTGCAVPGCERPARERGWCHAHYRRWTRYGEPGDAAIGPYRQGPRTCEVDGCLAAPWTAGLCSAHYQGLYGLPRRRRMR